MNRKYFETTIQNLNNDFINNDPTALINKMYILEEIEEDNFITDTDKMQLKELIIF